MRKTGLFFLLAGLCWGGVADAPAHRKLWWPVTLTGEVNGTYDLRCGALQFTGSYRFHLEWRGAMERDNGDYILYQDSQRIRDMAWREFQYDLTTGRMQETPPGHREPGFKVGYVVREGEALAFALEMTPLLLGGADTGPCRVWLPRSAENSGRMAGRPYRLDVIEGSNRLEIPEKPCYSQESLEKTFTWTWRHRGPQGVQHHRIDLELRVNRREK